MNAKLTTRNLRLRRGMRLFNILPPQMATIADNVWRRWYAEFGPDPWEG